MFKKFILNKKQLIQNVEQISRRSYNNKKVLPDLTKDRYSVVRGKFAQLTDTDINHFENLLGTTRVISNATETESYNVDFMGSLRGYSRLVLKPQTTEEVSKILNYCNTKKLAVCPQGGNTGLVGGSVPVFDEIVLSTEFMNKIEKIDELSGILQCQSGCILEILEKAVSEKGFCMPLDLGAKGSCHIGGNVSTNAGGLRLLRYGSLHGSVLGLEVVKADGTILNLLSNFKKDNTGYHLKHLFIGSEGTLGIVTKVAIFCPTSSKAISVAFLGLNNYSDVLKTFLTAKKDLGEILSSCELIDNASLAISTKAYGLQSPIESNYPFYMLIETSGSNGEHDEEKLTSFLDLAIENGLVVDGTVTNEPSKIKKIWELREKIPTALITDGHVFKYDISLPLTNFYDIVLATKKRAGSLATRVCGYGHIGDANLHLNVSCNEYTKEIHECLEPFVYEYTSKVGGSISAEHGVGFLKPKYLKYSKSNNAIQLMKELKLSFDPNGILNPYKVLD